VNEHDQVSEEHQRAGLVEQGEAGRDPTQQRGDPEDDLDERHQPGRREEPARPAGDASAA
jgi:hypothetical protein